ncbi:MAG: hypothetical protein ACJAVV_000052 [Alphaproteobacteria bacterium]|jgi:hypothetical protein
MKLLTKITVISVLTFSVLGIVNAAPVLVPTDNYVTSKLCVAAAQGNKVKLAREIKNAHLSKDFVIKNVKCNDLSFTAFVDQYATK